ncbi:serine/threonine protein kinase [Actinoallomurus spadix]|uniref:Protein kinase domain-containing protein n=1 Tax=Actinoallomurus spadix TaxID=79912 RepID=A0ABN0XNX0_9ACTN|nr:serine/threonine-protein kinase [Actinoallomurus spadix]MCO5991334.1 serine/threonine protein kinase [Actinoallomurus spadix]
MLARRAHYAPSVLSVAAAGYRLPTWDVTAAFVTACDGDLDEWRERWTALHAALQTAHPEMITDAGPPASDPETPRDETEDPRASSGDSPPTSAGDTGTQPEELPASVLPLGPSDPAKVGPFRLLGRLGGGAMGQVYLGESKTGRPVTVKVVRPHLAEDPHFRRRFVAEVAAVRRVDSPYTPAVIDAAPDADPPWMATAYIPGPSLGEVVRFEGPLPPATVLRLAAGIAEALEQIHAAGILHRDLKPANVLIEPTGPKVIDFGVAQADDGTRMTQTGAHVGTIPFMAPEQADGRPVTAASDIFALGSVLAYAATGVLPFGDGTNGEVLYRIIHTDPDPAALDCHDERLRGLITRCLDKDPARRPTPEQIIDTCSGQRLRMNWLPDSVDAWARRSVEDIGALLGRAAGRRARSVRLRLGAALVVVVVATAGVTAALTRGSGASDRKGGGRPSPVASPRAWTASSGPSCATAGAVGMDTSGSWTALAGTATGSCGNALTHRTSDNAAGANWVFHPGAGRTCAFRIDLPNSTAVDANAVTYQAWDTLPGKHTDEHRIGGNVRADQLASRGKAITLTFGPTKSGLIDLQLYDNYDDHRTEVAGTVTATCR